MILFKNISKRLCHVCFFLYYSASKASILTLLLTPDVAAICGPVRHLSLRLETQFAQLGPGASQSLSVLVRATLCCLLKDEILVSWLVVTWNNIHLFVRTKTDD